MALNFPESKPKSEQESGRNTIEIPASGMPETAVNPETARSGETPVSAAASKEHPGAETSIESAMGAGAAFSGTPQARLHANEMPEEQRTQEFAKFMEYLNGTKKVPLDASAAAALQEQADAFEMQDDDPELK